MDIGRAFTYIFQDPQWLKKALLAIVMLIIPIIGWLILYGYMLRIMRQSALGIDVPLPEWDDFGGDLVRGLKGFVAQLGWSVPVILVTACVTFVTQLVTAMAERNEGTTALLSLITLCANCLTWILSLVVTFVAPVFLTRLAVTNRLGPAFAIAEVFREARRSVTDLLIVLVLSLVLGFIALFGVLLCFVGVLATSIYVMVVQSHLYGQVRRRLGTLGDASALVSDTPSV